MKYRIIILFPVLLIGSLSASPNRCRSGMRCTTNTSAGMPHLLSVLPGKCGTPITMMIDEGELLPMHNYLRNF
jgi:hypothetical protein